jgi:hypothetical protein
MNIHTMEFVFICRRENFADFDIPAPNTKRLRDTLKANALAAAGAPPKKRQKKEVLEVDHEGQGAGTGTTHVSYGDEGSIVFRKVCYEIDKAALLRHYAELV